MKLEDIGFYTLSDERARTSTPTSDMKRGEIIITDQCNFNCPYCRKLRTDCQGDMRTTKIMRIIDLWSKDNLENIRFSGGEPTVRGGLSYIVKYAKDAGIKRIAISTNGSANLSLYKKLIEDGVNDFSISLDACCSQVGKKMNGGVDNAWEKTISNIKELSKLTYVTLGMVFTDDNIDNAVKSIEFGHSLGVADIRIVSSAQCNKKLNVVDVPSEIIEAHPILKYRINNYSMGRNVRGISSSDTDICPLVFDDSAIAGDYHFPCIIYLREKGEPIGKVGPNMRKERCEWVKHHNTHKDPICSKNCLDVCIDYNNKATRGDY